MPEVRKKQIFIGLSGGVDSAVSASLLQEAGAFVHAVFVKGWYPPGMPCTWAQDRRDAMRVAAHLGLPFTTLDASARYKRSVIDYLVAEYGAGRTPNPDVMCNRDIKFGALYAFAKERGAEYLATGHYVDGEKDQRYFLWAVPKERWDSLVFPLAGMTKARVRALAASRNLPVARKPDSQGVCFLGDISVDEFLREQFAPESGPAHDGSGTLIGRHDGAVLYTLGERVSLREARSAGPWFVRAKDLANNLLTVSREREPASAAAIGFSVPNWIREPHSVAVAQLRYRGPRVPGTIRDNLFVPRDALSEPYAPGQSIVFYDEQGELVGGAVLA